MDEREWLTSNYPAKMIKYLRDNNLITEKQYNLIFYDPIGSDMETLIVDVLRDIVGNPWRPVKRDICSNCGGKGSLYAPIDEGGIDCRCDNGFKRISWLTPNVIELAKTIEFGKCPNCDGQIRYQPGDHGCLDCSSTGGVQHIYPILADALEEAGCEVPQILRHLRGWERCPNECENGRFIRNNGDWFHCSKCKGEGWFKTDKPHYRGCWAVQLILGNN